MFFDSLRRIRNAVERNSDLRLVPRTLYLLVGLFGTTIVLIIIASSIPARVAIMTSYILTTQLIITNIFFVIIFNDLITQIQGFNRNSSSVSAVYETMCKNSEDDESSELEQSEKLPMLLEDTQS